MNSKSLMTVVTIDNDDNPNFFALFGACGFLIRDATRWCACANVIPTLSALDIPKWNFKCTWGK